MSGSMQLEDELDISRGDMIVREHNQPHMEQDIELMICWMSQKKIVQNGKYIVKHITNDVKCIVKEINYKVNINTLHRIEEDKEIGMNDIARIRIRTTRHLLYDRYTSNLITGRLVLIDEGTNETVCAGMIL